MLCPPNPEDTLYWYLLTPKQRAGREGREFKAFYKELTKRPPLRKLTYTDVLIDDAYHLEEE